MTNNCKFYVFCLSFKIRNLNQDIAESKLSSQIKR